jgi:hypothetical protein
MRGDDVQQQAMFSYLSPEARVPEDHPLRPIRNMVNQALAELSEEFQTIYSREGRPSIAGKAAVRFVAPGPLYHPQRTTLDGAVGLQSPVSLVRGPIHGRQGLGSFRLFLKVGSKLHP